MRTVLLTLLLVSCLPLAAAADHGPPTWAFTGTVSSVNDPGGFLGISVSDAASGRIVWTTTMTQIFNGATAAFYQESAGSAIGVELSVGGFDWDPAAAANVTLQIHDDNLTFDDRFSLSDAAVTNTGGFTYSASGLSVTLQDEDQTIFASTAIPAALPSISSFETATASLTLTNINGGTDSANITIDLITLQEEVHSPGSSVPAATLGGLMVLAGLLAWEGARRAGAPR